MPGAPPPPPVDQRRPGSPLHHRHRLRLLVTQDLVPDPPRHRPLRRRGISHAGRGASSPDHQSGHQKALAHRRSAAEPEPEIMGLHPRSSPAGHGQQGHRSSPAGGVLRQAQRRKGPGIQSTSNMVRMCSIPLTTRGYAPGRTAGPEKRHTSVSTGPDCKNADPNKFAKTASVVRENPGSPAPAPPSE